MVEVTPVSGAADEYLAKQQEVTAEQYSALPVAVNNQGKVLSGTRLLSINLDRKTYTQVRVINLTPDPDAGWVGTITEERSFFETTEQGGAPPTRVVEFERNDHGITGLAMSPDGTRIAFSVASYKSEEMDDIRDLNLEEHRELPLKHANLQMVKTTGGGLQHVTAENFQDLFPAFTADGEHILFCSNRRRSTSMDILRGSASGRGGISNVYLDQRNGRAVGPSQGKDGTVAFALYREGWRKPTDVQIWTVGGPNQFPTQIALGMQPQISPDGSEIAYIGGDGNLWVVKADGTDVTQLTSGSASILMRYKQSLSGVAREQFEAYEREGAVLRHYHPYSYPHWSPDGKRVLFTSMEGNDPTGRPNHDIWIMNRDGTNKQQLTTNGSVDRFPVMSSDQRHVYFLSNRGVGAKWAIWRIPAP